MMREKLFAGLAAFGIYFLMLGLILYYFGYRHESRPTHFVQKNEKGIAVSLAGPSRPGPRKTPAKTRPKPKHHPKPRNVTSKKAHPVKAPVKKAPSRKHPDTKKLFSKVKLPKKQPPRPGGGKKGSTGKKGESLKKSSHDSGVENAYLARVESLLKGWPAQANFAGEEIDIRLTIYKDGSFDYKILKLSNNPDFNRELIAYLKQLQRVGFGPHRREKPYDIEVQFIAHE